MTALSLRDRAGLYSHFVPDGARAAAQDHSVVRDFPKRRPIKCEYESRNEILTTACRVTPFTVRWRVLSSVHSRQRRPGYARLLLSRRRAHNAYVTPLDAQDFLERYDPAILEFESPRPFSFTLDARQLSRMRPAKPGMGARARGNPDQT